MTDIFIIRREYTDEDYSTWSSNYVKFEEVAYCATESIAQAKISLFQKEYDSKFEAYCRAQQTNQEWVLQNPKPVISEFNIAKPKKMDGESEKEYQGRIFAWRDAKAAHELPVTQWSMQNNILNNIFAPTKEKYVICKVHLLEDPI